MHAAQNISNPRRQHAGRQEQLEHILRNMKAVQQKRYGQKHLAKQQEESSSQHEQLVAQAQSITQKPGRKRDENQIDDIPTVGKGVSQRQDEFRKIGMPGILAEVLGVQAVNPINQKRNHGKHAAGHERGQQAILRGKNHLSVGEGRIDRHQQRQNDEGQHRNTRPKSQVIGLQALKLGETHGTGGMGTDTEHPDWR